jgi:hypothetical protein
MKSASLTWKISMFVRIWAWFLALSVLFRFLPLPRLVAWLSSASRFRRGDRAPTNLGRIVWRSLSIGGYQPRCLTAALVLYRLLTEQGESPELVIGLPGDAQDNRAHAWVEIDGADVGPPPGKQGHEELARYAGHALGATPSAVHTPH